MTVEFSSTLMGPAVSLADINTIHGKSISLTIALKCSYSIDFDVGPSNDTIHLLPVARGANSQSRHLSVAAEPGDRTTIDLGHSSMAAGLST